VYGGPVALYDFPDLSGRSYLRSMRGGLKSPKSRGRVIMGGWLGWKWWKSCG